MIVKTTEPPKWRKCRNREGSSRVGKWSENESWTECNGDGKRRKRSERQLWSQKPRFLGRRIRWISRQVRGTRKIREKCGVRSSPASWRDLMGAQLG